MSICSSPEDRWSLPVRKREESGQQTIPKISTVPLRLSCSPPTHPVPVEAKAEAVQLLSHGLDVTEEGTQIGNVNLYTKN